MKKEKEYSRLRNIDLRRKNNIDQILKWGEDRLLKRSWIGDNVAYTQIWKK